MPADTGRSILVPVDFGEASARAVEIGGMIARAWPAHLRLLHAEALEAPVYFTHEQVEALAAQRRKLAEQAEGFLAKFGRQHTSPPFTTTVEAKAPTVAILEHAAVADLVVMGTHGRRGPSLWWLGSVAERVLRDIDRPLLVVHADDEAAHLFNRVCVCAEPPDGGGPALALARELAAPFGGTVNDRRGCPVPADSLAEATLLVVATPKEGDRLARSRVGLSRIRTRAGSVLFVPE
jgi:nucleotide-binding universal stress UspA family protein